MSKLASLKMVLGKNLGRQLGKVYGKADKILEFHSGIRKVSPSLKWFGGTQSFFPLRITGAESQHM